MDTQTFTPTDIVNFAGQKDAVNLKAAFDQMVGQKVVDAIHARKIEVASAMFNPQQDEVEAAANSEEQGEEDHQAVEDATQEDQPSGDAGEEQTAQAQETEESDEDTEVTN